jgi:two-component system, OmpR family, phosphate regulon sensor histidine kinase PhoR
MRNISYISNMAMTKKAVGIIVVLIVISLTGLVVIQVYLLGSSITLTEQTFRRDVLSTLGAVTEALEARETVKTAMDVGGQVPGGKNIAVFAQIRREEAADSPNMIGILNCADTLLPSLRKTDGGLAYCLPTPQHVIVQLLDSAGTPDTTLVDQFCPAGVHSLDYVRGKLDSSQYSVRLLADSTVQIIHMGSSNDVGSDNPAADDSGKIRFVLNVLDRLREQEWRPIEDRLDSTTLDSVLKRHLTEAGFDLGYVYGVAATGRDSLWLGPRESADELLNTEYRARLFPHDYFAPQFDLLLYFPQGKIYIWKQVGPMLLSTFAFLAIIIYCFVYIIRTMMAQKRHAALMIDFVNNMTHEFKTPISTIALAGEAVLRPDVIADKERVSQYSRLILDENRRMRNQTEKILQMAALEEGDLDLRLDTVDLHQVIRDAVDNMAIQVASREGAINCSLEAANSSIRADKVHLCNIIMTLLDNANKYSPEKPLISVSTWNGNHGVYIRIEDKGMGISEEHIKHVFEKYYRVPTGNVHDVKGFGLGLSYARLITEAHGGRIGLTSQPGVGTQVELFFPISDGNISEVSDGA